MLTDNKNREKIIICKSFGKKRQSPRKLASKCRNNGLRGFYDTIRRYLRTNINVVKPYHCRKIQHLTPNHLTNRLKLLQKDNYLDLRGLETISFFYDESPLKLFHPPNPKNDAVRTQSVCEVQHVPVPKFSPKVMVWGTACSLTSHTSIESLS